MPSPWRFCCTTEPPDSFPHRPDRASRSWSKPDWGPLPSGAQPDDVRRPTGVFGPWLLAGSLLVRGAGLGAATIAVMAGAFEGVPHDEVADASGTTRIVQLVGGSFGAAVLAVILTRQLISLDAIGAASRGATFDIAFWWAIGFGVLAVLPALLLPNKGIPALMPLASARSRAAPGPPS